MWEKSEKPIPINGVRLSTQAAGIRYANRQDMCLIEVAAGGRTAGVFTQNLFCAAPVILAKQHLKQRNDIRYLLINTGSANAGTGEEGLQMSQKICSSLASLCQVESQQVLPFSTGVIGEGLPVEKMQKVLPQLVEQLTEDGWSEAAEAIMTTDTRPKTVSYRFALNGQWAHITGMAKGAGMIKPNMATMLAFIATDCNLSQPQLQESLHSVVGSSFNAISVDGDTSTNDALMLMSTARSPVNIQTTEDLQVFQSALLQVCQDLAKDIILDAEGATKFINIRISGGRSESECRQIGFCIAESPLVKTAMFASDANWGRILAAVGRSGVALDIQKVRISLGTTLVVEGGTRANSYTNADGQREMEKSQIDLSIDLGLGNAQAHIWTCDLSHEYIKINAEYRT